MLLKRVISIFAAIYRDYMILGFIMHECLSIVSSIPGHGDVYLIQLCDKLC